MSSPDCRTYGNRIDAVISIVSDLWEINDSTKNAKNEEKKFKKQGVNIGAFSFHSQSQKSTFCRIYDVIVLNRHISCIL